MSVASSARVKVLGMAKERKDIRRLFSRSRLVENERYAGRAFPFSRPVSD